MYTLNEANASRLELPGRTCMVLVGNEKIVAKKMTFGVTEVPPKTKMIPHRHKEEEIIYILKGYGEVQVNNNIEEIKEGTVIHLPSDSEHFIENKSSKTMKFTFAFSPPVKVGSYDSNQE